MPYSFHYFIEILLRKSGEPALLIEEISSPLLSNSFFNDIMVKKSFDPGVFSICRSESSCLNLKFKTCLGTNVSRETFTGSKKSQRFFTGKSRLPGVLFRSPFRLPDLN